MLPSIHLLNLIIATITLIYLYIQRSFSEPTNKIPFFLKKFESQIYSASLNESINPCSNFYDFSCGEWTKKSMKSPFEPLWNQWLDANYKINKKLQNLLSTKSEEESMKKAQIFYESCNQNFNETTEIEYLNNLRELIHEFKDWPLICDKWNINNNYNWLKELIKIIQTLKISPVFNFQVEIDYKNSTKYSLYIEAGNLIFPRYILLNASKYRSELIAYEKWIIESIKQLYPYQITRKTRLEVKEMIKFEIVLARMEKKSKTERTTFSKLRRKFPIFRKFDKTINSELSPNDTIIIRNYNYFKNMIISLQKPKIRRTFANYLIWNVIKELSRETSRKLRNLNFLINQVVFGIQTDLSRETECANKVHELMGVSLIPTYLANHNQAAILTKVRGMADKIKREFMKLLENNDWLSPETRLKCVEKVERIRFFIGYPKWAGNQSNVNKYFNSVNLTNNHFMNILKLKQLSFENEVMKLRIQKIKSTDDAEWPSSVFEVNAYYSMLQNVIFIPLGLLVAPFFVLERPNALNYGALGTLIGHELSHSLDSIGRNADESGSIRKWWKPNDISQFELRAKCFQNQFDSYSVNGALTLSENIADTVGLEISFHAYKNFKSDDPISQIVHNLGNYNIDQLFFVSFSQIWCEIVPETDLFDENHAPVKNRVLGTLYNSLNFDRTFNCDFGSRENKKCKLW